MLSDSIRRFVETHRWLCKALAVVLVLIYPICTSAQLSTGYYQKKFDDLRQITEAMINDFANASLDSACLNKANFDIATQYLDAESKTVAVKLRDAGIKTMNEMRAWKTCGNQREQASKLASDMSSADAWSSQRAAAKKSAMLAANEEIEGGTLVDHDTKAAISSPAKPAFPIDANTLLSGTYGARGNFDAILTISEDGLVTKCEVVSSIGNDTADRAICRHAILFMRYRPAFVDGKIMKANVHLRVRAD